MRLATSNNLLLVLQDAPKHILHSPGRGEGGRGYGGAERLRKRLYTYRYTVTTRMTPAFYYNWFSRGQLGKHHVHLTGLVSVIFSMSFVFVSNYLLLYFWVEILSDFYYFFVRPFVIGSYTKSCLISVNIMHMFTLRVINKVFGTTRGLNASIK